MLHSLMREVEYKASDFANPLRTDGLSQQAEITMPLEDQFWSECLEEESALPFGDKITTDELYKKFVAFCDGIGHKKRIDRKGTFIRRLCKSSGCLKSQSIRDVHGNVARGINLPPASECREAFNERYGMDVC